MPCNTDYMEPTANEYQRLDEKKSHVKDHLDYLAHQADLMREDILAVIEKRQNALTMNFSKITIKTPQLDDLLDKYHSQYAYRHDETFEALVQNVRDQYESVVRAGKRLKRNATLPKKTVTDIATQQVLHRFGDMIRIMAQYSTKSTFKPREVSEVLKYAQVDYTKPLIPQIGFDPDDV